MKITKVKSDYAIKPFDCGNTDLNGFLMNDSKNYYEKNIAFTFVLEDADGSMVGYYSLLNDKISKKEVLNADWRRVRKRFPHSKHFDSYPAIKIGRFAISKAYSRKGYGSKLMTIVKRTLLNKDADSAFRFLTVDAYLEAVPFYERNGFKQLIAKDNDKHTRLMYFDLLEV